jgi:tetratricopeptide (TPR) repeat protein
MDYGMSSAIEDPIAASSQLGLASFVSVFLAVVVVVWSSVAVWLLHGGLPEGNVGKETNGGENGVSIINRIVKGLTDFFDGKESFAYTRKHLSILGDILRSEAGKLEEPCLKGLAQALRGDTLSFDSGGGRESRDKAAEHDRAFATDFDTAEELADLAAFRDQLRDKLTSLISSGGSRAATVDDPLGLLALSSHGVYKRDLLEDFLKAVLNPSRLEDRAGTSSSSSTVKSQGADVRGKLLDLDNASVKDNGCKSRPRPSILLLAQRAKEIGNKYLQERQFSAAAHCYEVACLLHPVSGSGCSEELAAYHCNSSLACLELGRYGDAINEANAALSLKPPRRLEVKALYRLAVGHANLKNLFEARLCLKACLELDPKNEYANTFLARLGEEVQPQGSSPEPCLRWLEPPKRAQHLGAVAAARAKKKTTKQQQKNGINGFDEATPVVSGSGVCGRDNKDVINIGCNFRIDREAGLWHTMVRHHNKLYILGGLSAASGESPMSETSSSSPKCGGGGAASDELHVLDLETLHLTGLPKPPHPCLGHTATMGDRTW